MEIVDYICRMKKNILLVIILLSTVCFSQNLVVNPSFENASICPIDSLDFQYVDGWENSVLHPSEGLPSHPWYFDRCGNTAHGVPSNQYGYQKAFSGESYGNIVTYKKKWPNSRTFITGSFISPLDPVDYAFSFYVSLTETSRFSCDNFSVRAYIALPLEIELDNRVEGTTTASVTDKTGWIKVEGTFKAKGGELYFSIGNHFDDAHSTYHLIQGPLAISNYYIDDVCISIPGTCAITSTTPEQSQTLPFYPTYGTKANTNAPVDVYDSRGVFLFRSKDPDLSGYPTGVYILRGGVRCGKFLRL